jgi:8-oxo-dGTP pyrophosphatase MutT (NUDIX family)
MATQDKPRRRRASRVILLDPAGRVLLLHTRNWWITVGGGIDPGETSIEAAVREVREETGIVITAADLGPVIHETTHLLRWDEGDLVEQINEFRIAHVAACEADFSGFTPLEAATIDSARWWTEGELRTTVENVAATRASR